MLFDRVMFFSNARNKIVGWVIIESVHVLNVFRNPEPWPTLDDLFEYPDESFGRTVAEFLRARSLPFKTRYENHDAIHAILDYDVDSRGEMELQAFMWGNRSSSFAGHILFVWGGLMLPEYWPAMRRAHARGRAARPIEEAKLPHRLRETITNIRDGLEPCAA